MAQDEPTVSAFVEILTLKITQVNESQKNQERKFESFQQEMRDAVITMGEKRVDDKETLRASTSAFGQALGDVLIKMAKIQTEQRIIMFLASAALVAIIGVIVKMSIGVTP